MNVISQQTAHDIWHCHREIAAAHELMEKIEEGLKFKETPNLRDAFGRPRGLELGVPSGDDSRKLYGVPWHLAASVIRTHIAEQTRKLTELTEVARLEIEGRVTEPVPSP